MERASCILIQQGKCGSIFTINSSRVMDLGLRILNIRFFFEVQGSQSVNEYYSKLKQLWEELKNHESPYRCCCGRENCDSYKRLIERDEQDRVLKFLMGLSDTYTATRGQILMMEPKPSITKVFNLVSQEER